MKRKKEKFVKGRISAGSALILAVVLTSLLAIVGVLFVMTARVERISTSAISENRELNLAVETVVEHITQLLVSDIPGVQNPFGADEYYDYPDANNAWLASSEPYDNMGNPEWRQVSNITGMSIPWNLPAEYVPDYQLPADVDVGLAGDADGDGVSDSIWVLLPDMTSSKGRPIFVAVRVIDNGGMLNVNTGFKFDPNQIDIKSDGASQMQINLAELSQRGGNGLPDAAADWLHGWRCGAELPDLSLYERNVVWRYNEPNGLYTPFDIADELELRNRFLVNQTGIDVRIEEVWDYAFQKPNRETPVSQNTELTNWFYRAQHDVPGPNDIYSYPHLGTTYNMDRIIAPGGVRMLNVNRIYDPNDLGLLYQAIQLGLADAGVTDDARAAQMAVNLVDYHDADSEVTTFDLDSDGTNDYFGFEQPCVYISELAHNFVTLNPNEPGVCYRSYAIELYKPYSEDDNPVNWRLAINWGKPGEIKKTIDWSGDSQFQVVRWIDENAPLVVDFNDANDPDPNDPNDPNETDPNLNRFVNPLNEIIFAAGDTITLHRPVPGGADANVVVDSLLVPEEPASGWLQPDAGSLSIERDIKAHKCIRRLWAGTAGAGGTLGQANVFEDPNLYMIQAHPANKAFTNIGEVGMVFHLPAYYEMGKLPPLPPIGYSPNADSEPKVRVDLANPGYQQIFNYLTVFDPSSDWINNDGDRLPDGTEIIDEEDELKIPGRININTAPWYVIGQLPWVSAHAPNFELAQAIAAHRDSVGPFKSIGELNNVVNPVPILSIDYYGRDAIDLAGMPDLTPEDGDGAAGNFEERDAIFARISNLVTVRSDVFTAYILVRLGIDGPQKRAIAILDRSDVYPDGPGGTIGKVKVRALHPVHDPR